MRPGKSLWISLALSQLPSTVVPMAIGIITKKQVNESKREISGDTHLLMVRVLFSPKLIFITPSSIPAKSQT
jgi:hypothetical protein